MRLIRSLLIAVLVMVLVLAGFYRYFAPKSPLPLGLNVPNVPFIGYNPCHPESEGGVVGAAYAAGAVVRSVADSDGLSTKELEAGFIRMATDVGHAWGAIKRGLRGKPAPVKVPHQAPPATDLVTTPASMAECAAPVVPVLAGDLERVTLANGEVVNARTARMLEAAGSPHVTQGSFSTRVAASSGTHAGGGVVDVTTDDYPGTVRRMVAAGFAAWHRLPSQGPWPEHIHAVAIGDPTLSPSAKAQEGAWLRGGDGLAGTPDPPVVVVPAVAAAPRPDLPADVNTPGPRPYPEKVVALYHMMWPDSGSPKLDATPAGVNVVNLAFVQGDPPRMVGWGSQDKGSLIADVRQLRARGVRVVVSVGGAHGHVNISNRGAFVGGIVELAHEVGLDGLDWDVEGYAMAHDDVVEISRTLKNRLGQDFAITLAPNGSNVDGYINVAADLHRNGLLDMIGQQFYDAVVTPDAAIGRIAQMRGAGIPEDRIGVGMMVGPEDKYWTVDECLNVVSQVRARFPGVRGGYLWEAGRADTRAWVDRVGPALRGEA